MARKRNPARIPSRSWDDVAAWYEGWCGPDGSEHHRRLAIPTALELLGDIRNRRVLDVGCGPGPLAPSIVASGGRYTGLDLSRKLLAAARRRHGAGAAFIHGDATRLSGIPELGQQKYDAVVFLLSIQDINPLEPALHGAADRLAAGGRVVIVMTHPCFRVPRQSGWGWDAHRRLCYRRVDGYLTPRQVPMGASAPGRAAPTRSYHRPLGEYITILADAGLHIDALREIPGFRMPSGNAVARARTRANEEIPLFLALRAVKP